MFLHVVQGYIKVSPFPFSMFINYLEDELILKNVQASSNIFY